MSNRKFQLVVKHCKCGCGSTWKALPTSPNEFWSRSHSEQKYQPWRTERSKFRKVKQWLRETFGEEEKETDQERLREIDRDEITI